eukprot:718556-Pelagomonas_calceolata.AAC.2
MPAEMRDSWNRAYKFLERSSRLPLTGFYIMVLALLLGTKATLMLSLCALSQADLPTLTLTRSLLETGTITLLNFNSALAPTPFPFWKLLQLSIMLPTPCCQHHVASIMLPTPCCQHHNEAQGAQLKKSKEEQQRDCA